MTLGDIMLYGGNYLSEWKKNQSIGEHGMRKQKGYHSETHLIHLSIWMIGLGIFFLFGHVWPGIFILIGISMLIESLSRGNESISDTPQPLEAVDISREKPVEESKETETKQTYPFSDSSEEHSEPTFSNRIDLLPERCPWCGAPVHSSEIHWQGYYKASCTFCGADLIDGGQ